MRRGAGYYSDRMTHLIQSESASGNAGARTETFTDGNTYWCCMREPRGAERIYWGSLSSAVDCVVQFHGTPSIRSVDRLRDESDGTLYLINGVGWDDDEGDVVCACTGLRETLP